MFAAQTEEFPSEAGTVRYLERVRYVAGNYSDLRGLSTLPVVLPCLVWAAWDIGLLGKAGWLYLLLSTMLAGVLTRAINLYYYDRSYGLVRTFRQTRSLRHSILFGLVAGPGMIGLPSSSRVALTMALLTFILFWPRRAFTRHWLVLASLLAAFSILPAVDLGLFRGVSESPSAWDPLVKILVALTLVVGGIIDHWLLIRTLKPLPAEAELETV